MTAQSTPAETPLFGCQNIDLTLGGRQILYDVGVEAYAGQILGVVGPNGLERHRCSKCSVAASPCSAAQ